MLLFVMLLLCSCSTVKYQQIKPPELDQTIINQMSIIYDTDQEKSFCLSSKGIHNIIEGHFLSVDLPLCNRAEMVVHTHPDSFLGEKGPTNTDLKTWQTYKQKYGNWVFGIMTSSKTLKVYILE